MREERQQGPYMPCGHPVGRLAPVLGGSQVCLVCGAEYTESEVLRASSVIADGAMWQKVEAESNG